ncbi:hypothetical protein NPIL_660491 [Nephila pilipes]|uniref:Uncharacterized protein n=1 Tax=Nephila pilipes TaxID=299642 RepID=A0A8X6PCF4_NEPPI|nr:hypothetical protein NPIL_660491 [Nephila pilipes]
MNPLTRHISEFSDPKTGFNPFVNLKEGYVNETRPPLFSNDRSNDIQAGQGDTFSKPGLTLWNLLMESKSNLSKDDQEIILNKEVLSMFNPIDNKETSSNTFHSGKSTEKLQASLHTSTTVLDSKRRGKLTKSPKHKNKSGNKQRQSINDESNKYHPTDILLYFSIILLSVSASAALTYGIKYCIKKIRIPLE